MTGRSSVPPGVSRVLIAVVLGPVVLYLVWLGGWWLAALILVGALLALHELYRMARAHRPIVLAGFCGALLAVCGAQLGGVGWLLGGLLSTLVIAFLVWGVTSTRHSAVVALATTFLGVAWVAVGLSHFILLRDVPDHGRALVFAVILAVFADDTFAYAVGRLIGRHRLVPSISPGKSWEGFVAGTIAAVLTTFFALYDQDAVSTGQSLLLGAAVALAATLGDLFESAVKRDVGVKDSGALLGGHGGVLDRIDSLLWAGPAAFYVLLALDRVGG